MMFGRFIYGVGAECSGVAYSAIISKWFRGKELNFALGFNLSVVGGILTPVLMTREDGIISSEMWFGTIAVCVFSLFCGIIMVVLDIYAENRDGEI
jgi:MFS family permease